MAIRDALTGAQTVISEKRQDRPNLPDSSCPFCPGGREAPEPYEVTWFVNRWPAMPEDRCEVILYTPDHDASMWSLGVDGARKVVDLWAERTAELSAREDVRYVLIFENRGAEVGATIYHPHGQIYAFDEVPPAPLRELVDGFLDPHLIPTELRVSGAGDWIAWVPEAATYPFELRIAPLSPVGAIDDPNCDRDGLAGVLVDSLARLDQLFGEEMPYMLWIHQRPCGIEQWPGARLHLHVVPTLRAAGTPRFVAAAELGSEIYFNPVAPAEAAARLRGEDGFR